MIRVLKRLLASHQISSQVCDGIPDAGECEPAAEEAEGEDEEDVAPLDVQHRVEEVGDVTTTALSDVRSFDADQTWTQLTLISHYLS